MTKTEEYRRHPPANGTITQYRDLTSSVLKRYTAAMQVVLELRSKAWAYPPFLCFSSGSNYFSKINLRFDMKNDGGQVFEILNALDKAKQ